MRTGVHASAADEGVKQARGVAALRSAGLPGQSDASLNPSNKYYMLYAVYARIWRAWQLTLLLLHTRSYPVCSKTITPQGPRTPDGRLCCPPGAPRARAL
jgi:hypothetical protein